MSNTLELKAVKTNNDSHNYEKLCANLNHNPLIQSEPEETLTIARSVLDLCMETLLTHKSGNSIELDENLQTGLINMQLCAMEAIRFEESRIANDYNPKNTENK